MHCPADEKFHREEGLAGAGGAADKRRASGRQAAAGNFVKTGDAGQFLLETKSPYSGGYDDSF